MPRRHQSGELDWTARKLLYEAANSILTRSRETVALKAWTMKIAKCPGLTRPASGQCNVRLCLAHSTSPPAPVIGRCCKRHRASEFLDFLKRIDAEMPEGPDVHLMMDNYATNKTPKIKA